MWLISTVLKKYYRFIVIILFVGCQQINTNNIKKINGYALGTSYSITYLSESLESNILITHIDSITKFLSFYFKKKGSLRRFLSIFLYFLLS